jgi:hypothetical protein
VRLALQRLLGRRLSRICASIAPAAGEPEQEQEEIDEVLGCDDPHMPSALVDVLLIVGIGLFVAVLLNGRHAPV